MVATHGVPVVEVQIGDGEVERFDYEEFEERVANGRIDPSARIRFEPVTGEDFVVAEELDLYRSIRDQSAVAWQTRFRNSGPPLLTALLVGVQVRIWLWAQLGDFGGPLVNGGVNWLSPALENGEPYRLITYGLLHTDFLHILLNMVWMTYTGWNIERALGKANLAAIFFFSVVLGGLLSMFFTPGVPSLGASGGVYGLVAASVVFGFIRQDLLPEKGRRLFGAALAPYLVLMFLSGLTNAQTDNWAHFGGLVMGGGLALVLDPPGFERRAGQNRWVQGIGSAVIATLLVVFTFAGPSLYPLVDKDQARLDALPAASRARALQNSGLILTELTWSVPAGWKTGTNAAGDSGFVSPMRGQDRSIAVLQKENARPRTVDEVRDLWIEQVKRGHPDAAVNEIPAVGWVGRPADSVRTVRVELPNGRILTWSGTTRGVYGMYRVVEVEGVMEDRLEPLFQRVEASIDWREPLELQAARRNLLATPNGVKARTEYGIALAKWGEAAEALEVFESLTNDRPDSPDRWVQWLEVAGWYPQTSNLDDLLSKALQRREPEVRVAVADLLREGGDPITADGILQLAWLQMPGDRKVKRALRRAGLRWALSPAGLPAQVAWLPDGTLRPDEAVFALQEVDLTQASAARWAQTFAAEREQVAAGFPGAVDRGEGVAWLLRIRDGGFEPLFDKQDRLRRDLMAVQGDRPPNWMGATLREALTPAVLEALIAELTPTEPAR